MKLASHNSWSYLPPRKWWMKPLKFTAKCQDVDIQTQYEKYDVRCFDLRLKFRNGAPVVVHNTIEYDIDSVGLSKDLEWLDSKGDVYIRIILDIRCKKEYTMEQKGLFIDFCYDVEKYFPHIRFWCGEGLYDKEVLYKFKYHPSCEEKYASVCSPKLLDDWWPRMYAKKNNRKLLKEGTKKQYLMLDFVNYCKEAE